MMRIAGNNNPTRYYIIWSNVLGDKEGLTRILHFRRCRKTIFTAVWVFCIVLPERRFSALQTTVILHNININVYLAGFSKRLSTAISVVSQVPPSPNFPVSSSYKTRNCLNITNIFDILNKTFEKVATSLWLETIGETRVFLKSKTKLDRKRLSKSRSSTNFEARFVRREKLLVEKFCNKKEKIFRFPVF